MTNILLISEDKIKTESALNDNVWGKFLMPAIREAQDINLSQILGENLLDEIYTRVTANTVTGDYKTLLEDYIQPFLLYQVQANIVPTLNVKMANIGTVLTGDEHVEKLSKSDVDNFAQNIQYKADFYCRRLQEYLLANEDVFGLESCQCQRIKSNLNSAASTGLWLGGIRNRVLRQDCC